MAVLDAFIAISEDLKVKFSRGSMPLDLPSFLTLHAFAFRVRISHLKIRSAGPAIIPGENEGPTHSLLLWATP